MIEMMTKTIRHIINREISITKNEEQACREILLGRGWRSFYEWLSRLVSREQANSPPPQ